MLKHFSFALLLFAGTAVGLHAADVIPPANEDDAIFYEDFSRYQDGWAAKVYKGVFKIGKDEKFVRSKGGNLTGDMMGPMAIDWWGRKATAFRFRLRFVDTVHPLQLTFKNWGFRVPESPFRRYILKLTSDSAELVLDGQRPNPKPDPKKPDAKLQTFEYPALPAPVKFESVKLKPFQANKWYDVELQALEDRMRFFVRQDNRWICVMDCPVAKGGGLPSFEYPQGELDLGPMILTDVSPPEKEQGKGKK